MKDGGGGSKGFYSLTFNGQLVYILEMTTVQPKYNLYLSLGDPNFNYGDANSKIRNIVIAEPVISDEFCENFLRITSSADISLCSQNENEESSDWAGGEIQVSSWH